MMIIMESLDTMLSDAVSISALLSYTDTKYHKLRQLKKQMSNISTPSPAASPEPIESDVISQTVLKTINNVDTPEEDGVHVQPQEKADSETLETPVTLGEEFFPCSISVSSSLPSSSTTCLVQSASELTELKLSGKKSSHVPLIHFCLRPRVMLLSLLYLMDLTDKNRVKERWRLEVMSEVAWNITI